MQPQVVRVGANPKDKARQFYLKIVSPIYNRSRTEFLFFVGWIIKQLSTRGSTANPAIVAARVFAHGLYVCTDAQQWAELGPVVKANTTPEIYAEMTNLYHIGQPGPQEHVDLP